MISYTDDKYSELWEGYNKISKNTLINALHKVFDLFKIEPPKPKMISVDYWENGLCLGCRL